MNIGRGSLHIQRYPAEVIVVMHTVAAAADFQFVYRPGSSLPPTLKSLTAPFMETNMDTQIL